MFGSKRRLSALEARVQAIEKAQESLDVVELERMRTSVLNALRAYRRSVTAVEARTGNGEGSDKGDAIDRQLRLRRGH